MTCPDGRRILWGWLQESRAREALMAAGWAGCMSLPRVLGVHPDGSLQQRPAAELQTLLNHVRTLKITHEDRVLAERLKALSLPDRSGRITYTLRTGKACTMHLALNEAAESKPLLDVVYDGHHDLIISNVSVPLHPDPFGISKIDLWIDGSVLEMFVDKREVLTTRNYELPNLSAGVILSWEGPASSLRSLQAASISPVSADRLSS